MFLSAVWGSSFIFIKLSVETIPPTLLTSYRLIIASIFLLFFCSFKKIKELIVKNKRDLFIIGFFGNVVPFNLISWSQLYIDSVAASTLIGTMPLFTFIISLCFFEKEFQIQKILGLMIGFLGLLIFLNPESGSYNNFFYSLIIIASIMYAFSANWVKVLENKSSFELACCSISLATLLSIPTTLFILYFSEFNFNLFIVTLSTSSFVSATILGILCTGLAITTFFYLIKLRSPVFASQSNYLIPCFGFIWSYMFLGESLSLNLLAGLTLIVIGAYFVNR
ncbi:MAG: DMT family transporter [Candidatus Pelagibacter sp. TMED153]|nr:MAG: DMT family transporter [Candidatus Pelagibacter sp. TMED153]